MNKKRFYQDVLLKQTLKKEDRICIPTDEKFYEAMEKNIMSAIEKSEVKAANKWEKPWVFLEPMTELNEGSVSLKSTSLRVVKIQSNN